MRERKTLAAKASPVTCCLVELVSPLRCLPALATSIWELTLAKAKEISAGRTACLGSKYIVSAVTDFEDAIRSASKIIAFGLATLKLRVATSGSPKKLTPVPF